MRVVPALGPLLVVAVMTMGVSVCGSSVPVTTPKPTPPPTGDIIATPGSSIETPIPIPTDPLAALSPQPTPMALSQDQNLQIENVIRADPAIAEIAGSDTYYITQYGPWYAGGEDPITGDETLIGGIATVTFSRPIPHIERDWPFAGYRPYYGAWPAEARAKYLPYTPGHEQRAVDNLKTMDVFVDLINREVAGIEISGDPGAGQVVSYPSPTGPTPEFTFGVTSDVQAIFDGDARLGAVLSGRSYQGVLSVTSSSESPHLRIASETFIFERSQDIEADWLLILDGDMESGDYTSDTIHFKATDVRSVRALVDLDRGELVAIEPSEHAPGD